MRWNARTLWLRVHLWLGLSAGAVLVLLGLTGSLLVFYPRLDAALAPGVMTAEGSGEPLPLGEILDAARAAYTGTAEPTWVLLPEVDRGAYVVRFDEPRGEGTLDPVWFMMDPYTGAALGQRIWGEYAMSWVYELHHTLHLGDAGETTVGIIGVLLVVSLLTGIYLWWPSFRADARRALTLKRGARGARRHRDLHNTFGIYGAAALLVVGLSGTYLVFHEAFDAAAASVARVTPYPTVASTARPGARPIPAHRAVAAADSVFPDAELKYVALPVGAAGVYWVFMRQPGEIGDASAQSQVWVDQYSGEVLAVRDWKRLTAMDRVLATLLPLHSGAALGPVGKWLVFASGFVPLLLYVTGVRMWWRKRGGRRRREERLAAPAPVAVRHAGREALWAARQ